MNTLLVGALAGLIAGVLFAPQSGKQTRGVFKERFSFFRDAWMRRGSTNDGATEESLEDTVRADYLH
jgi:gas vesicle protein